SCLAAVSQLRLRGKTDESTVRNTIAPQKAALQRILQERLLAELAESLPDAKRQVQIAIEHLSDVVDYSRHPSDGKYEQSVERAEGLLGQLVQEVTEGKPKEGRIEAVRVRTRRPFGLGYKGVAPPLRRTERGVKNGVRRSHVESGACY